VQGAARRATAQLAEAEKKQLVEALEAGALSQRNTTALGTLGTGKSFEFFQLEVLR
jgi:hypothetical protein